MNAQQAIDIIDRDMMRLLRYHDELVLTSARYRRNIDKQVAQAIAEITDQGRLLTPGPRMYAVMNDLESALVKILGTSGAEQYLKTASAIITKRANDMNRLVKRLGLPEEALMGPDVTRNPRFIHALDRISTAMAQGNDSARMSIANSISKYKRLANTSDRLPYKQMLNELKSATNIPARYVGTVANTSLASMDREMRQDQATRADIQKAKYVGPLDSVTRVYCFNHVNRVESWQYWEQSLNSVGPNPPARYGGGWNCRHALVPWLDEWSETKKQIASEPAPRVDEKVGEALTKESAQAQTQSIFESQGVNVSSTTFDSSLTLAQMNSRNAQLASLLDEYEVHPRFKENPTKITWQSGGGKHGFVSPRAGKYEMNFGHSTDLRFREQDRDALTRFFQMPKSLVDASNVDLATLTHEMAHVMSISSKYTSFGNKKDIAFFGDMKRLKTRYKTELNKLARAGKTREALDIYLGDYANKDVDEFFAEGFTEYKLSSKPSKYAKLIGELVDKYFKKK